jgi:hypothetical protein
VFHPGKLALFDILCVILRSLIGSSHRLLLIALRHGSYRRAVFVSLRHEITGHSLKPLG